jgi:hypothetical protein
MIIFTNKVPISSDVYPMGMLKNTLTGRYHPIAFRLNIYATPIPNFEKYKSLGHHTAGFDTLEEAMQFIKDDPSMVFTGDMWEWDGVNMPAMVAWAKTGDDN